LDFGACEGFCDCSYVGSWYGSDATVLVTSPANGTAAGI